MLIDTRLTNTWN